MSEKTSKYKGVCKVKNISAKWAKKDWQASITTNEGRQAFKYFESEREAALWVDMKLIAMGRHPVNILKSLKRIL